jgi:putative hemolysin
MAIALLAIAALLLALRAVAAGGSAAVYAPLAPRTSASLEAGAAAAAVVAAGTASLALLLTVGSAALLVVVLAAPLFVLVFDLLPRALAQADVALLPPKVRTFAHHFLAAACTPLRIVERAMARLAGGARDHVVPAAGQILSDLLRRERPADDSLLSSGQVIHRIFDFRDTRVREVMVPLIHIFAVRDDARLEEVIGWIRREKVSRVPVFHERMYNIVGIVHSLDVLGVPPDQPVASVMRPPLYVPENKLAQHQLRLMQRRGINMAVVVDEHGGAVGIVTVEDLLEEIVGEIEDEYDQREVLYETLADGAVRVQGGMEIARLNEIFPWRLPTGDYETIAGLVITQLERIPRAGQRLRLPNVTIEVARADQRAVREVIVHPVSEG